MPQRLNGSETERQASRTKRYKNAEQEECQQWPTSVCDL